MPMNQYNTAVCPFTVTDVRALPGDSAFLLDNGQTALLCDSGFAFTGERITDNIAHILGSRSLDGILLTHSHYDHALGSVYVRRRYPKARTVAGEHAAAVFAKPTARAVMRDLDRKWAAKNGIGDYPDYIDSIAADIAVRDGDIITFKDTHFRVIALPGHTRCSVGYYAEDCGLLIGCETLGVYLGGDCYMPSCLVGYEMTLASIARAGTLDIRHMLIPHFGLIGAEEAKTYLSRSEQVTRETAESFLSLMKRGLDDAEILDRYRRNVYTDEIAPFYPEDAFLLNSKIMISLIRRECFSGT